MIKQVLIILSIIIILFLYFLNIWLEEENIQVKQLNKKYIADIKKLKTISKIDKWLHEKVKKNLKDLPKESSVADLKLIGFFDRYAKKYNLKVKKFIESDDFAHILTITFTLPRANYKLLKKFINQEYKSGYIMIENIKVDKSSVEGDLILVQPFLTHKTIKSEAIDVVPQ